MASSITQQSSHRFISSRDISSATWRNVVRSLSNGMASKLSGFLLLRASVSSKAKLLRIQACEMVFRFCRVMSYA